MDPSAFVVLWKEVQPVEITIVARSFVKEGEYGR